VWTKYVLCIVGASDTLNLEERGVGVGVALSALVRQVLALHVYYRYHRQSLPTLFSTQLQKAMVAQDWESCSHL
jgi:hypothetical protein